MDDILQDERFQHIAKDVRFRKLKHQEKKVKIDKRFKDMFDDNRFKLTYLVDKRGRPLCNTTSENLRRYYDISDSDIENDDKEEETFDIAKPSLEEVGDESTLNKKQKSFKKDKSHKKGSEKQLPVEEAKLNTKKKEKKTKLEQVETLVSPKVKSKKEPKHAKKKGKKELKSVESAEESSYLSDDQADESGSPSKKYDASSSLDLDASLKLDYARGEAQLDSSSDDSAFEYDDDELDHRWGELDKDAAETDEITCRLAVCNMDWDRIKARDIMLVFHSYVPQGGLIKSVKIYPSEFGLQRMEEENRLGPVELKSNKNENDKNVVDTKDGHYDQERLRRYQLQRLKYYFAVVECDSPQTANHIYEQCDGVEYESSSNKLDLRFIPEDMTFDQQPTQVSTELPTNASYKASLFFSSALQQSKVNLTWDETDPDRVSVLMKKFDPKDVDNLDVRDYLASDSEGEDPLPMVDNDDDNDIEEDEEVQVEKYRRLMKELNKDEKDDSDNCDMEITWEPELKENVENLVKDKQKKDNLTPWEQYVEKLKEKKKTKKRERKSMKPNDSDEEECSEPVNSDEGMDHEQDNSDSDEDLKKSKFKKDNTQGHDSETDFSGGAGNLKKAKQKHKTRSKESKSEAELSLLLSEETDDKHHFNLKKLMGSEKNKKQRKRKNAEEAEVDNFHMDVNDSRFSALFNNPNFNIDPSAPEFKKTKVMDDLIQHKVKKRQSNLNDGGKLDNIFCAESSSSGISTEVPAKVIEKLDRKIDYSTASLNQLVKSVKAKTVLLNEQKKLKSKTPNVKGH